MSAPPAYDEVAGSSSSGGPPPPPHEKAGQSQYPSASQEKQHLASHHANQSHGHASSGASDKVLKIWHAASGNSLVTAADESTPLYNVIDSRAPDEAEQRRQSQRFESEVTSHASGLERRDPSKKSTVPDDIQFAREIQSQRAHPSSHASPQFSAVWILTVRRGGDRNSEPLATIKRHVNTNSAVVIELHQQQPGNMVKTGIERKSGFPHSKYEFHLHGRIFTWQKTHKAPGTSRLDGGNYVCKDEKGQVYAYSTSEDDRCDGSLYFEERSIDEGLLDVMTITGFVMRDLDNERENPSYMRYRGTPYGGGGYGPYGNPYMAAGYGYYPMMGYGMGFPLLL